MTFSSISNGTFPDLSLFFRELAGMSSGRNEIEKNRGGGKGWWSKGWAKGSRQNIVAFGI